MDRRRTLVAIALLGLGLGALRHAYRPGGATERLPGAEVAGATPATPAARAAAAQAIARAAGPCVDDGSIPEQPDLDHDHDRPHDAASLPVRSSWLPEEVTRRLDAAGEGAIRAVARRAIPAAGRLLKATNPSRPLDPALRERLRPTFGDLVDRVQVADGAELPDDVLHTGGAEALTIGDRVYVRRRLDPGEPADVRLLAHELVHVRQFERFGRDLGAFSEELGLQLAAARWDEERTPFELEANGLVLVEPGQAGLAGALTR